MDLNHLKLLDDNTPARKIMQNARSAHRNAEPIGGDANAQALRRLGSRAHQLRAATRAADHFSQQDSDEDGRTASWLMSCALGLAEELASDIDDLARALRDGSAEAALQRSLASVRVHAHQLHAASRAADRFLEQENQEDRETGSWLIACAHGLADKLAAELDNSVMPVRRPTVDKARMEGHDPQVVRAMNAAMPPARA
jgi:hypothetical protein